MLYWSELYCSAQFFPIWAVEKVLCNWLWICLRYVEEWPIVVVLREERIVSWTDAERCESMLFIS